MKLLKILSKNSGRNSKGRITVRHQGGRHKRFLREIDWKRNKFDIPGTVEEIVYDPNRTSDIALVVYKDGERRYILAPQGLIQGALVISGDNPPLDIGTNLPLKNIPVGTQIHNVEIRPGKGGQLVKSAGSVAVVFSKEDPWVLVKMPSNEIRRFEPDCRATIGQIGKIDAKARNFKKAGTKRRMGIRPTVRGTAQNPRSHPHGGGEGRSGVGMKYPKTPWGAPAVGRTRRLKKYSDRLIVSRRKLGKHAGGIV